MRKLLTMLAVVACAVLGAVAAFQVTPAQGHPADKVTLCHLADGPAKAGLITVATEAAYHGHYLQHSADVIPPFEYQGETYSLNWTGAFPEECSGSGTTTEEKPPPPTTTDEEKPPPPTTTDDELFPVCDPESGEIIFVHDYEFFEANDPACQEKKKDVCPNLGGDQTTVPVGYELVDGKCVKPDEPPVKVNEPPGTPVGDCVVQANRELLCGEQG